MILDKSEFVFCSVKAVTISDWDSMLGFPVEDILPEHFYIDRENQLVGIKAVEIASIQFDKIFYSTTELLSLDMVPQIVLDRISDALDQEENVSLFKKVRSIFSKTVVESTTNAIDALRLVYAISRVRFEIFCFVIVNLSCLQADEIKRLKRLDKTRDFNNLNTAYKDLIGRVSKDVLEKHLKANPGFLNCIPEDGVVVNSTTLN